MRLEAAADRQPSAGFPPLSEPCEQGFVLITVLWIVALLAAAAIAFTVSMRSQLLLQRNLASLAQAERIADGLTRWSALRLAEGNIDGAALAGRMDYCRWSPDIRAGIAIQDQGGLIDINAASPALLSALIDGLAPNPASAQAAFAEILDYRDLDQTAQRGGDEPAIYPGRPFGPKDDAFQTVDELDQIPSLEGGLFTRLRPLLTVSSQQMGFDLARAPAALLTALSPQGGDLSQWSSPSPSKVFEITATVLMPSGTIFSRRTLISLTFQPDRPYATLSWQRGTFAELSWPPAAGLEACVN